MSVTAEKVNELRQKTGAGMMECKKALTETQGDLEKAIDVLRKRGLAAASKKAGRITAEGMVGTYLHGGGRVGVVVEVNCETDFVAKNEDFNQFVKDICLHICANKPQYVNPDEVPNEILDREREIARDQARTQGKKEEFLAKIVEGKVQRYFEEVCLMEQGFVKDPNLKVKDLITQLVAKIGENIKVRRFTRFELGEGLEKRKEDFAAEVAAKMGQN
jgi:elongation factor Ts